VPPGGVTPGAGEADGGPGVGEAGQIFTGRRPAGLQGPAVAGSARTNGETASSRATTDAYEVFRVEFILTIVWFHRRQPGNPGPVRLLCQRRPWKASTMVQAIGISGRRTPGLAPSKCSGNHLTLSAPFLPA
jgi:hypothetical protein